MDSLSVRVSQETHGLLRELAESTGESMTDLIDRAVQDYRKQRFWAEYHAAYAALRADPVAWADFQSEIELWESAVGDGLEDEEPWDSTSADGLEDEPDAIREETDRPVSG